MLSQSGQHTSKVMRLLEAGAAAQSEVVASWDRCVTLHGLHPDRDTHVDILTSHEFRDARGQIECQLRVAEPDLLSLTRQVIKAGFFLSVTDAHGTALIHRGTSPSGGGVHDKIVDGMQWREQLQGTNAVGTGLLECRPRIIVRDEHFFASNTSLTCLVAPLYDACGQLFGAINIATDRQDFESSYSSVFMATLVTTAQHIEARLFRAAYPGALIVSLPEIAGSDGSVPLVAVNSDMAILGATRSARTIHRITTKSLQGGLSLHHLIPDMESNEASLWKAEETALRRAISDAGGNISRAAKQLGISRATIYRKILAHAVSVKRGRRPSD